MEATTKYDYRAKVDEELSFRKGQHLKVKYHHMLYNQIVMGNLTGHLYNRRFVLCSVCATGYKKMSCEIASRSSSTSSFPILAQSLQ